MAVLHGEASSPAFLVGALRSRLVAKLTDLTRRQLGYWHRTGLIRAQVVPGARGYPRLYSWADYMRLREAAKLTAAGVPTPTIRKAIEFLERHVPGWYLVPLRVEGADVIAHLQAEDLDVAANLNGQVSLFQTLQTLHDEGPLGELHAFKDAVAMHPRVCAGTPVLADTRIETAFIAGLKDRGYPAEEIAGVYGLPLHQVHRAIEFEELVA